MGNTVPPLAEPQYRKMKWSEDGPTPIKPLEDSSNGGFILFEQINPEDTKQAEYFVRVFVSSDVQTFSWTKQKTETLHVVDVPTGFSINNGEVLAGYLPPPPKPPPPIAGGPVIVHGRP